MEFKNLSDKQKTELFGDYTIDYLSTNPKDPKRFLSRHNELLNEDAVTFALRLANATWFQVAANQSSEAAMNSLYLGIFAFTISIEIKKDHLAAQSAEFLSRKNYLIGDKQSSTEWEIEAKKHRNCTALSFERKEKLLPPLINVMYDNPGMGLEYLNAHSELLTDEVANWALSLARAYYQAFLIRKLELFEVSVLNLATVAYIIAGEIKKFEVASQACDLIADLFEVLEKHEDVVFWKKAAATIRNNLK